MGVYQGGGAQSRIPLFPPTFWNSYPAYQKNPISNPPYPIAFPNLQIPHTKKFNDKILHTKKNERQILLSRFLFWPQIFGNFLSLIIYRLQRGQRDSSITLLEMLSG